MNDLQGYLENLIYSCHYPITFSADRQAFMHKWIVKSMDPPSLIPDSSYPFLDMEGDILLPEEIEQISREQLEKNWRYYCCRATDEELFVEYCRNNPEIYFSKDEDKYIYCMACIYSENVQDVLFFLDPQVPLRVWINETLVFKSTAHYLIKQYTFAVRLKKGINIVLVEKALYMRFKGFSHYQNRFHLEYIPFEKMLNSDAARFFDANQVKTIQENYNIVLDKAFFEDGENIKLTILPRSIKKSEAEKILIRVLDAGNREIAAKEAVTFEKVTLDIGLTARGTFHIIVCSMTDDMKSEAYFFRGEFEGFTSELICKAEERADCSISDAVKRIAQIPDIQSCCFKGTSELMSQLIYKPILEQLFLMEKTILHTDKCFGRKRTFEVPHKKLMVFKNSEIDSGFTAYSIYFPRSYSAKKKYPLAIYLNFGVGYSSYPYAQEFAENQMFDGAFIVNICGRGGLNRDYINEGAILKIISEVSGNYNVDRGRIYCIGSCTGTLKAIGMALRKPDLFAAVIGIEGTARLDIRNPEYAYLKNMGNTRIYQLNNIEDAVFNNARVINTSKYFKKHKSFNLSGFSHIQFDTFFNSGELIKILLNTRKKRYPKNIYFTLDEPIYNKSHWIRVDYIRELVLKSHISARIIDSDHIEVQCENIERFTLLLCKDGMRLKEWVNLKINDQTNTVQIRKHSKTLITITGNCITTDTSYMSEDDFNEEYDSFEIDEKLLGIKQVYYSKCIVVKPDGSYASKDNLLKKIFHFVKNPLKEKARNYRYDILQECDLSSDALSKCNFVYIMDPNRESSIQNRIIKEVGLNFGESCFKYGGRKYENNYFALVKQDNPFNKEKSVLLIIYSSDTVFSEMADILKSFDCNQIFYYDTIIYNNGTYEYYRRNDPREFGNLINGGVIKCIKC